MEKQEIAALIQSFGITYKAVFVPFSQSRNKNEKHFSLNWLVTIERGSQSITTDYMQGIGHLAGYSHAAASKLAEYNNVKHAAESGKWDARHNKAGFRTTPQLYWNKIPAPELVDVMYSLVMDSDVLNYSGFEDWASNFGYDTDSREAEKTYQACLKIALELRAMIGNSGIEKLQEAFQDY